jgi:hypothetical protein
VGVAYTKLAIDPMLRSTQMRSILLFQSPVSAVCRRGPVVDFREPLQSAWVTPSVGMETDFMATGYIGV